VWRIQRLQPFNGVAVDVDPAIVPLIVYVIQSILHSLKQSNGFNGEWAHNGICGDKRKSQFEKSRFDYQYIIGLVVTMKTYAGLNRYCHCHLLRSARVAIAYEIASRKVVQSPRLYREV
jgi:hypothetical protein